MITKKIHLNVMVSDNVMIKSLWTCNINIMLFILLLVCVFLSVVVLLWLLISSLCIRQSEYWSWILFISLCINTIIQTWASASASAFSSQSVKSVLQQRFILHPNSSPLIHVCFIFMYNKHSVFLLYFTLLCFTLLLNPNHQNEQK